MVLPDQTGLHGNFFGTNLLRLRQNEYPGDDLLPALRRSFSYAGYWLSNPPGDDHNPWVGKRETLKANGFGFLLLYNGRLDAAYRKGCGGARPFGR